MKPVPEDTMKGWTAINEVLDFAIGEEQSAAEFYTSLAQKTTVPGMREALTDFAREELDHRARLEAIREGSGFSFAIENVEDLKIAEYVVNVIPDPQLSYREALIVAMNKEKAAIRLYTDLAKMAPSDALRTTFLALAQEESQHKLRFESEFDDLLADN
jgi:rubrerythrin